VHKFKVFRTGKLQLPGLSKDTIDDVKICARKVAEILNVVLKPSTPAQVMYMNPVMRNYKFMLKLLPCQLIDLTALREVMIAESRTAARPKIFSVQFSRQDINFGIKFCTPIAKDPTKTTRVNIYMRGKINILGGYYSADTRAICEYLCRIFDQFHYKLVVAEWNSASWSLPRAKSPETSLADNICCDDAAEVCARFAQWRRVKYWEKIV